VSDLRGSAKFLAAICFSDNHFHVTGARSERERCDRRDIISLNPRPCPGPPEWVSTWPISRADRYRPPSSYK